MDVRLVMRVGEEPNIASANPNPWITHTEIEFSLSQASEGKWEFYDVNGKKNYSKVDSYKVGLHKIKIANDDVRATGIIYVKLTTDQRVAEYKMIVVN